jgi:putative ABC transport system permease protein
MLQDIRLALRRFAQRPVFATLVVFTLALGIGATTAIFSVVHGTLLKPLPFREPDRLVHIWEGRGNDRFVRGSDQGFISVRAGTFHDWKAQSRSFENMAAYYWKNTLITGGDKPDVVWAHQVTEGFFETLDVAPEIGRTFQPDDYRNDGPTVVVISHHLWQNRFGADRSIAGHTLSIDGLPHTVVGVMPKGFYPTDIASPADLWLPYAFPADLKWNRVRWGLTLFARLKPGVAYEQAQAELDVVARAVSAAHPEHYENMLAVVTPVAGYMLGRHEPLFFVLLGAAAMLLLISIVNVANLLLARALERHSEFAVRVALGAGRWRLIRESLIEGALLAMCGGVAGLLFAWLGLRLVLQLLPRTSRVPRLDEVQVDGSVLAFTLAVSLLTGFVFALLPALRGARSNLNETLKEQGRSACQLGSRRRLADLLVVAQIAVSLVLLVAAALLGQSFYRLLATDPGVRTDNVLTAFLTVPEAQYGKPEVGGENRSRALLYEEIERRLAHLPGIRAAAVAAQIPLAHGHNPWSISIEGRGPPARGAHSGGAARIVRTGLYDHGSVSVQRVGPGYFRTFGIPILQGRAFDELDRRDAPQVIILNEMAVRRFFPKENPIGRQITIDFTSYFPKGAVVGIAANCRMNGIEREVHPQIFLPMAQWPTAGAWVAVRSEQDPKAMFADVRKAIHAINPDLAVIEERSMRTVLGQSLWRPRFAAFLLATFATLAVILTAAGLYGVVSYSVRRRTFELGIRMALGARGADVVWMVLRQGLALAAVGILAGVVAFLLLNRLIAGQLHQVRANDPLTLAAVAFGILGVALMACLAPASQAARVDPLVALRHG